MKKSTYTKMTVTVAALLLAGCSSNYMVTFDSNPRGATLLCSGTNWGYTPINLYYDESVKKQSTINVSSCSAHWVSGATASYPSNLTIFPQGATTITLPRPNVEGYATDANFALQVQNLQYQKRQAEAAESAAYSAAAAASAAETSNNKRTTCIDYGSGIISCN